MYSALSTKGRLIGSIKIVSNDFAIYLGSGVRSSIKIKFVFNDVKNEHLHHIFLKP